MTDDWREDLRLELEQLIDKYVVDGVLPRDVFDAVGHELERLRQVQAHDPDPADDDTVISEPANDWPGQ